MATIKSEYYRFNGTIWDMYYFKTSADVIVETTTKKVMTDTERTAISTYLVTFNAASKLVQLDASSKIPSGLLPFYIADYLQKNNPVISGVLSGGHINMGSNEVRFGGTTNRIVSSPNGIRIYYDGGSKYLDLGQQIDANNSKFINLANPTANQDAATKSYVDGLIAEGVKPVDPVKAATTANITLSGTQTIDGVSCLVGDRVLVKNQSTASQNGIYTVASGSWVKVSNDSLIGTLVFVENGSTQNDYKYYNKTGTSWILFSRTDTIQEGAGLSKVGTTISISNLGINTDMVQNNAITMGKIANFPIWEDGTGWGDVVNSYGTGQSLIANIEALALAIKLLRGTTSFNTNNTESISAAYTLANSKNKNEAGATVPGTSGYSTGDVFLRTL